MTIEKTRDVGKLRGVVILIVAMGGLMTLGAVSNQQPLQTEAQAKYEADLNKRYEQTQPSQSNQSPSSTPAQQTTQPPPWRNTSECVDLLYSVAAKGGIVAVNGAYKTRTELERMCAGMPAR
jgi:hypothetical protein